MSRIATSRIDWILAKVADCVAERKILDAWSGSSSDRPFYLCEATLDYLKNSPTLCYCNPVVVKNNNQILVDRIEELLLSLLTCAAVTLKDSHADIFGLSVGDFNGDAYSDFLISFGPRDQVSSRVYWGQNNGTFAQGPLLKFVAEPTSLDCNLDGRSDILGPVDDGRNLTCFTFIKNGSFQATLSFILEGPGGRHPSFVDIQKEDLDPELLVVTGQNENLKVEIWTPVSDPSANELWTQEEALEPFAGVKPPPVTVGPPTFGDFEANGQMGILLPYCTKDSCGHDEVFLRIYNGSLWTQVPLLVQDEKAWFLNTQSPETLTLRVADYTRDGFPDLLVMANGPYGLKAFVAENVPCSGDACEVFPRTFRLDHTHQLLSDYKVSMAAFFDLQEDGSLDFLIERELGDKETPPAGSKIPYEIVPEIGRDKADTCFLKVQVSTPTCGKKCPNGEGTGIALPGACLRYDMKNVDGSSRTGSTCQVPRTTSKALNSPFVVFGLDSTPNFVERLKVGIPFSPTPQTKDFKQIIPNSRLIIVPYPRDNAGKWTNRLYVMPSRLIWLSFASLCSVCGVILLIIIALHIRERRIDRKERLLEAHKFHFDAM